MAGRQRLLAAAAAGDKDSNHRTAHAIASRLSDPPEVGRRRLTIRRLRPKGADPPLRERWQGPYSHLLVDELQDVDAAQLRLVRILAEPERNLVVVGDDDQAVYGWLSPGRAAAAGHRIRRPDDLRRVHVVVNWRFESFLASQIPSQTAVSRCPAAGPGRSRRGPWMLSWMLSALGLWLRRLRVQAP